MSFQSTALALNPIRYYRLNTISGSSVPDLGSQNQAGTIHNGGFSTDQGMVNGDPATCGHFNSSSYVSIPTTGLPTGAAPFTIFLVTRMRPVPASGTYPTIFDMGVVGSNTRAGVYFDGDAKKYETLSLIAGASLKQTTAITDGFIYTIANVYDGTTMYFYSNGVLQQSAAVVMNLSYGQANIGNDITGNFPGYGDIQEMLIYSGALSAGQIASLNTAVVAGGTVASAPTDGYAIYEDCDPTSSDALARLTNIAAGGFKLVMNYALLSSHTHIADVIGYINNAASVGLKVIVALYYPQIWLSPAIAATFPLLYSDSGNQSTTAGFDTYIVNQTKNLAGTWGYYVADEPLNVNHTACKAHADAIVAAASTKPRLIVMSGESPGNSFWGSLSPFYDCCDVGGDDVYPVGDDFISSIPNSTITVASGTQAYCSLNSIQSALVLQSQNWNNYGTPPCSPAPQCAYFPYKSQMQQQLTDALANMTPRLILWYSYQDIFGSGAISSLSIPVPAVKHWSDLTSIIKPASGVVTQGNGRFLRIG